MKLIKFIFLGLSLIIPLLYLTKYLSSDSKHKNYLKSFFIAGILFGFFFLISLGTNYLPKDLFDNKNADNKANDKTNITTKVTNPTTKHYDIDIEYPKVSEVSGTKKDLGYTSKGYPIYSINDVIYVDGYLIANKSYALPRTYVPKNTHVNADGITKVCNLCISNDAYTAWEDMVRDARKNTVSIWIQSGYRPYVAQETIYNRYVSTDGKEKADTYSSRPGHSDHQTGLAFDLNTINDAFGETKAGKWINNNCYKYGFIIRFPKNKQDETGYKYESWHLRYVGTDLSYQLYNDGNWRSMEEYFGITSKYQD